MLSCGRCGSGRRAERSSSEIRSNSEECEREEDPNGFIAQFQQALKGN